MQANSSISIYLTAVQWAHTWVRPYGVVRNCNSTRNIYLTVVPTATPCVPLERGRSLVGGADDSSRNIYLTVVPKENGLPHQCAHWFAMTDLIQQTTDR